MKKSSGGEKTESRRESQVGERTISGSGGNRLRGPTSHRLRFRRGRQMQSLEHQAFTATIRLDPDIDNAAISGRSTSPTTGSNTPAAIGNAMVL